MAPFEAAALAAPKCLFIAMKSKNIGASNDPALALALALGHPAMIPWQGHPFLLAQSQTW